MSLEPLQNSEVVVPDRLIELFQKIANLPNDYESRNLVIAELLVILGTHTGELSVIVSNEMTQENTLIGQEQTPEESELNETVQVDSPDQTNTTKVLWKPSYGLDYYSTFDHHKHLNNEKKREKKIYSILKVLNNVLSEQNQDSYEVRNSLISIFNQSVWAKVFNQYFLNVTPHFVMHRLPIFTELVKLTTVLSTLHVTSKRVESEQLQMNFPTHNQIKTLMEFEKVLSRVGEIINIRNDGEEEEEEEDHLCKTREHTQLNEDFLQAKNVIIFFTSMATADENIESKTEFHSLQNDEVPEQFYEKLFKEELVKFVNLSPYHFFQSVATQEQTTTQDAKKRLKRLMQEFHSLESQLPLHFHSTILVRVDENCPYLFRVLITAPTKTPYDSGCFIFDMYCPSTYPTVPPKVNLMTTGGGTVRFNPNLYDDGYVCLSLLGTWEGSGSERWGPESTIFQVLLSIQSAILGSEFPYFNEPGVEDEWHSPEGLENARISDNGGYEYIRRESITYAMTDQLKQPMKEFEDIINLHFYLKIKHILTVTKDWTDEACTSDTEGYYLELLTRRSELIIELIKLSSNKFVLNKVESFHTEYNRSILELLELHKNQTEEAISKAEQERRLLPKPPLIDQLNEQPMEWLNEQPMQELNEQPMEWLNEQPMQELIEQPMEELIEQPTQELIEQPTQELNEQPMQELNEQSHTEF